jgi:hypothetical protein
MPERLPAADKNSFHFSSKIIMIRAGEPEEFGKLVE